ncbi:beta-ketoacyl-ACP synthase II [Desulfotomaculum copahuensis]|uniref:3-oxoacyl-[acyl-carrier-protein] synthase 2 n=1 Tax=Desulfotomaculum copahuensis TaxID=1838280 RepID=A0A1B7LIQ7_9FIRM|nr:beta-ketoacyl-ACP synthase II [Desulfotomaculum copahuensis]OAT86426.1 beta-ketoacyl-[acyl-carrier-protein] synthase II [Desulfotomaculum copahuensis]
MRERVVITGMGAVTPVGIGVESYWHNLLQGKCGVGYISRFDTSHLPVKIGAEVLDFRAEDFLPKKLLKETDLFMQFALAAAREALQDSGPAGAPERMGVVLGTAVGGIATIAESQEKLCRTGSVRISPHFMPRILGNVAAAQIAIAHGLTGPSLTVGTACSAGADAVGMAVMLLQRGEADVMLAVGAESILCPLVIAGLHAARALSTRNGAPEKASRPFDRRRDGLVMGEGAGAVVLETFSHARRRDARIRAELTGYANYGDAYHVTAPEPGGRGEILCMRRALERAGLTPGEIDYINAHGTSTPLGDRVETLAVRAVFGALAAQIPVSSTKGATGHLMGAGGVTELIACVKAIEEGMVPPTINYDEPDPECDLDYVPNHPRRVHVRAAMSNSFGFGGQNACLVVRRYI